MSLNQPFKSAGLIALTPTTLNVTVTSATVVPGDGENMVIVNDTGTTVYFDVSPNAAWGMTQANAQYAVAKNTRCIITVARGISYYVACNPAVTVAAGSVYFMRGDGSVY
jgi:hypothetical protein